NKEKLLQDLVLAPSRPIDGASAAVSASRAGHGGCCGQSGVCDADTSVEATAHSCGGQAGPLKRDLLEGRLTCADTTSALLASHLLQFEIGDYSETLDCEHLKANEYLSGQQRCLEKILEFHRKHMG
ncbi:hypothetical protein P7K49_033943, partial [Saguinus oedipus]